MRCFSLGVVSLLAGVIALAIPGRLLAEATQWDFDQGSLTASFGSAVLSYYNGTTTSDAVQYGTASSFGIAALPGGDAKVLKFDAFTSAQGLLGDANCGPNGSGTGNDGVNEYTMIFDVLASKPTSGYVSLLESNPSNTKDSHVAIKDNGDTGSFGGIHTYNGTVSWSQWHRLAVAVDLSNGVMKAYIDGDYVGTTTGLSCNNDPALWAMPPYDHSFLLLTDKDGDMTGSGYLNSVYFTNCVMSDAEITALGGPNAMGIIPEPNTLALLITGLVALLAYAWRKRK